MPLPGHTADCECPGCTRAIAQTEAIGFESFTVQLGDRRWVSIRFGVSRDGKLAVIRDIQVAVERGPFVEEQMVEKIIVVDTTAPVALSGLGAMPERPT